MTVLGRRVMERRKAERETAEAEALYELVEDIVAEVLPQLVVSALSDPTVIRAMRATLKGGTTSPVPPPLRAAQIKRLR